MSPLQDKDSFFSGGAVDAEKLNKLNDPDVLNYIATYHPYRVHGVRNDEFDNFSGYILDVKEAKAHAIMYFANCFLKTLNISDGVIICSVPSHSPNNTSGGVQQVIDLICQANKAINGARYLVRHTEVEKLSTGGARHKDIHLSSIRLDPSFTVHERNVLLLDDVKTSGHSLEACKEILMEQGAAAVKLFPFSVTG